MLSFSTLTFPVLPSPRSDALTTRRMPVFSLRLVVVPILLTALWLGIPLGVAAQPREKCTEDRAIAENRYLDGRFDEALTLLQQCLDREELFVDEAVQVYRLISLAHLNKGDLEQARQAVRTLLLHAPAYQADPVQDPPSYTTMVDVVRQELEAQALPEVTPETSVEEEEAPVLQEEPEEQPSADQPQPLADQPPADEQVATPLNIRPQPTQRRVLLRTPRSWLLATGGAIVVATAVALVFGGRSESSPAPPR